MNASGLSASTSTSKRPTDTTPPDTRQQQQQRSRKRAKYTQLACNECKRRKLKCSGEQICTRCIRDGVRCIYAPNNNNDNNNNNLNLEHNDASNPNLSIGGVSGCEAGSLSNQFRAVCDKMGALQREMLALGERVKELEVAAAAITPATASQAPSKSTTSASGLDRILNPPKSPSYVGPTSAEFGLPGMSMRNSSDLCLHASQTASEDGSGGESRLVHSPSVSECGVDAHDQDPLVSLGQAEALRLIEVYEDAVDIMYPCVDLESVREYIKAHYHGDYNDGSPKRVPTMRAGHIDEPPPGESDDQDWFYARDVQVLKLILAIALLAESHGRSERAARLADSVEDKFATRIKVATVDMKEELILTLLSIFHSYRDDEIYAWRLIGMAVRGCMELGLHCRETWVRTGGAFSGELRWTWASRLWWCIYVLDRKFSFGTGLPFAIQDSDIDTNLPEPDNSPYLTCMISYARLITKIWKLVVGWRSRPRTATTDSCAYLDLQVRQWIQSIPPELRFDPIWRSPSRPRHTGNVMTLQVLLALQANQLRILLYKQNLLSSDSIEADVAGASTAVETAKCTIHMLDYFSRVTDIYSRRPEPFNYFLLSALAALFLAVLHAPIRFGRVCRDEFYVAVGLVKRSSTRVETSRRLQKIMRSLRLIRLNFNGGLGQSGSEHRRRRRDTGTAATVDGQVDDHSSLSSSIPQLPHPRISSSDQISFLHPGPPMPATTITGPDHSGNDLTNFFEMAGAYFLEPGEMGNDNEIGRTDTQTDMNMNMHMHTTVDGIDLDIFQAENESLTSLMAGLL